MMCSSFFNIFGFISIQLFSKIARDPQVSYGFGKLEKRKRKQEIGQKILLKLLLSRANEVMRISFDLGNSVSSHAQHSQPIYSSQPWFKIDYMYEKDNKP